MSVYWNNGEYDGFCGELSLGVVFWRWYEHKQEQKYVLRLLRAGQLGYRQAYVLDVLTPHEDQDTEEVGPQHVWPDTDDGF